MTEDRTGLTPRRKRKFNWHEVRVGFFVIGSFAILIFMIFRVSGGRGFFTPKVQAITYLPAISGLKAGAPVWLNGIEVGNVETFMLEKELPATAANRRTKEKMVAIEGDIRRYDEAIRQTEEDLATRREGLTRTNTRQQSRLAEEVRTVENRLAGLRKTRTALDEEMKSQKSNLQSIKLVLKIEQEFGGWIKADSEVTIGSIGLLGDKYVDISIGRSEVEPAKLPDGSLVIEGLNEASIREMMVSANDLLANFGEISLRVKSIMAKLDTGEGTFGQLINNASLHQSLLSTVNSLDETVQSAGLVMQDIHQSEGTLGKLIRDKQLYTEIQSTIKNIREFTQRLASSEGTVDRLIRDPGLYENLKSVTSRLDAIMASIQSGQGTLGKLSTDDSLFREMRDSLQRIHSIMKQIDEGQGTMGRLLKDPQLHDNLNQVLSELTKLLYEIRKNPKKYLRVKFSIF